MVATVVDRRESTKVQFPTTLMVRHVTTDATASAASSASRRPARRAATCSQAGRAVVLSSSRSTGRPPQQEIEEDRAAHHADHRADRDLVRVTDEPADDVADQDETRAEHGDPGN